MPSNSSTAVIEKPEAVTSDLDCLFPLLLLATTFAALVLALVLGASEFISYDGYKSCGLRAGRHAPSPVTTEQKIVGTWDWTGTDLIERIIYRPDQHDGNYNGR